MFLLLLFFFNVNPNFFFTALTGTDLMAGCDRMRLVKGDEIVDVVVVPDSDGDKVNLLVVLSEGVGKRTVASQLRFQRRAGQGMILSRVKPKETVIAVRPCGK